MKLLLAAISAFALLAGPAAAQSYYDPYATQQQQTQQPSSGSTYDWQSGNRYSWNRDSQGNTTVRGSNLNTGSTWTNRIENNGNQSGRDSDGNYWRYNAQTGSYYNSDGTTCYGRGAYRTCTGPNN